MSVTLFTLVSIQSSHFHIPFRTFHEYWHSFFCRIQASEWSLLLRAQEWIWFIHSSTTHGVIVLWLGGILSCRTPELDEFDTPQLQLNWHCSWRVCIYLQCDSFMVRSGSNDGYLSGCNRVPPWANSWRCTWRLSFRIYSANCVDLVSRVSALRFPASEFWKVKGMKPGKCNNQRNECVEVRDCLPVSNTVVRWNFVWERQRVRYKRTHSYVLYCFPHGRCLAARERRFWSLQVK